MLNKFLAINENVFNGIIQSREKDMNNPFRKMVYESDLEQEKVLGKQSENSFIKEKSIERKQLINDVNIVLGQLKA